tara:strand:+ start:543 stop:701 length:159 start_codon:yes stop_codon:yes gene_type:complete
MQNLKNKPAPQETEKIEARKKAQQEVLHSIREDAQRDPKSYLMETVVPGGGE